MNDDEQQFLEELRGMGMARVKATLEEGVWVSWRRMIALEYVHLADEFRELELDSIEEKRHNRTIAVAQEANRISRGAAMASVGAFILAAIALARSFGWF